MRGTCGDSRCFGGSGDKTSFAARFKLGTGMGIGAVADESEGLGVEGDTMYVGRACKMCGKPVRALRSGSLGIACISQTTVDRQNTD